VSGNFKGGWKSCLGTPAQKKKRRAHPKKRIKNEMYAKGGFKDRVGDGNVGRCIKKGEGEGGKRQGGKGLSYGALILRPLKGET